MNRFRPVVRMALGVIFARATSISADAATADYSVLFDIDNNPATGCTVSGMGGVEQVLVTTVTTTATSASVTSSHRRVCSGGVLGGMTDLTGGWPAGYNPSSGALTVETRVPYAALGAGASPAPMQS